MSLKLKSKTRKALNPVTTATPTGTSSSVEDSSVFIAVPPQQQKIRVRFFPGDGPNTAVLVPKFQNYAQARTVSADAGRLSKGYHSKVNIEATLNQSGRIQSLELVPTASALIIKKLNEKRTYFGKHVALSKQSLSMEEVLEIAQLMRPRSKAKNLKGVVREVLGSCVSCGCLIEGKSPKSVLDDLFYGVGKYVFDEEGNRLKTFTEEQEVHDEENDVNLKSM
ncbi:hypothetical protein C9374_012634 [Naegleria lovaniensis]|uniref:Large ribosomal subunit protein uL11 C-terminal domain-containing protein n=1 Tax=Naegleria lovaniensis TaxID=51637 RepID=A0AA88H3E2_NAELO|nr:uncharacterized protein C9374_012634 [Naegleria lovaniensis]KAG2392382.1 hypothetical protein C9374_012634 [Naegleria lovaniensis]